MKIRLATKDDFNFYYDLKCEPSSIYWGGFNNAPEKRNLYEHFLNLMNKEFPNREFYILEDEGKARGYLQLTHNSDTEVEIGYGVSEKYRGCGYGAFILNQAKELILKMGDNVNLIGYVREDNHSSKKCFEKNNFVRRNKYIKRFFAQDNEDKKMYLFEWNNQLS